VQSSNPDIYAMGDIAAFPLGAMGGKLQRQEHVQCCRRVAGAWCLWWDG
jgi:NADPH-dependent 2,4-dienoyl-CoA reductase/sulfur reductase-like enzyme